MIFDIVVDGVSCKSKPASCNFFSSEQCGSRNLNPIARFLVCFVTCLQTLGYGLRAGSMSSGCKVYMGY